MKTCISWVTLLLSLALMAPLAAANPPEIINHQGRIAVAGTNFNGTGQFKFALVDGGTNISVQATATATVTSGFVTSISVTNGGSGYASAPSVAIVGGGGSGALVTASVSGGAVTGITVNSAGSGYMWIPDVDIAAPPASYTYVSYWSNDGTSTAGSEPTAAVSLTVTKGLYSVLLGDTSLTNMTAVPATVFNNTDVRLRVWFNDGTTGFQQLSPDQRIASVGYAMMAEHVPDGAITAAKIATGAVGDSQVGTLSQSEITNLTTDLAGKVARSGGDTLTGSYTISGTLDTGFGPNELYDMDQNVLTTSSPTFATLNTGNGPNELYDMDQNVLTTSTPTFMGLTSTGLVTVQGDLKVIESVGGTYYGTLDIGDLSVNTTYTFTGASGTVMTTGNDGTGSTFDADILDGHDSAWFATATHLHSAADITTGTLSDARLSSNVALRNSGNIFTSSQTINGTLAANTIDTGFGLNELYAMNQNVRTIDTPTFMGLTSTGLVTVQGDLKVIESSGTNYGTLDIGDLSVNTTYTFTGASGTVMTTGNDGTGSTFDADFLDGMTATSFAAASHTHSAGDVTAGTLSDTRLSSNVALLNGTNTFTSNQTMNSTLRVNSWIGIGRNSTGNELEVEGDASKTAAGSWLANSDRRIKLDIRTINGALDVLDKVRLVDFRYTDEYRSAHPGIVDRRYINVIAQEFAEVFPNQVKPSGETLADGSAILQVDTYPLTIYSAAAVQELHAATTALQKENAELKARLESIEALLMHTPAEYLAEQQITPKTP